MNLRVWGRNLTKNISYRECSQVFRVQGQVLGFKTFTTHNEILCYTSTWVTIVKSLSFCLFKIVGQGQTRHVCLLWCFPKVNLNRSQYFFFNPYGRQVGEQTFKKTNEVKSSHIVVALILKLKEHFVSHPPRASNATKISQFGEGMSKMFIELHWMYVKF